MSLLPWLVMVTTCVGALNPTPTGPKSNERGVTRCMEKEKFSHPRPIRSIVNSPALVSLFDVAVKAPVAMGENSKKYWQLAPGSTPAAQFCEAPNGEFTPPPAKLASVAFPLLVMVTVKVLLVSPTPTGPKSNTSGVTYNEGAVDSNSFSS